MKAICIDNKMLIGKDLLTIGNVYEIMDIEGDVCYVIDNIGDKRMFMLNRFSRSDYLVRHRNKILEELNID